MRGVDSCGPDVRRTVTSESHLLSVWASDIRTRLIHRAWPVEPLTLQPSYWSIKVMKEHGSRMRWVHGRKKVEFGGLLWTCCFVELSKQMLLCLLQVCVQVHWIPQMHSRWYQMIFWTVELMSGVMALAFFFLLILNTHKCNWLLQD